MAILRHDKGGELVDRDVRLGGGGAHRLERGRALGLLGIKYRGAVSRLGRGGPEFRVGGEERREEGVVDRVGKVGDAKSFAKRTDVVEAGRVRSAF